MTQSQRKLQSTSNLNLEKIPERSLVLLSSKSDFQRFLNYTTGNERRAAEREKEAVKLEAFKRATYEASKSWDNTIENIKKKRDAELLSRKKRGEKEREQFLKDMAAKNTVEREKVIEEARKLILFEKPLCRRINAALLTSECLRELNAQISFQKTLKEIDKAAKEKHAQFVKNDVEKFNNEEKIKCEEKAKKNHEYGQQVKKQMEERKKIQEMKENMKMQMDKQELEAILTEIQLAKDCELKSKTMKQEELRKDFLNAIEEKKRFQMESEKREEFADRALKIYLTAKTRIKKLHEQISQEEKIAKEHRSEIIGEHRRSLMGDRENQEEELYRKAKEEKEAIALDRIKLEKQKQENMKKTIENYRRDVVARKTKELQGQEELKLWELMQRFKRDEYNKKVESEIRQKIKEEKMKYAKELNQLTSEKKAIEKEEKLFDEEAEIWKKTVCQENKKILDYANEILEESKGVRPVYPIIKEIKKCEKDMDIMPSTKVSSPMPKRIKKKYRRIPRARPNYISENQIIYL